MTNLIAARCQMGVSLGFHIVFAVIGVAMPLMMVMAEAHYARSGDQTSLVLARRWARGTAILFTVGAVSGTVLSFELGLLWPRFMALAGAIFGWPFALEGFAFFTEAIFLGIYLFGWERLSRGMHLGAGVIVAISGALSSMFVVSANAWMNTPAGFTLIDGKPATVDPMAAMLNPAALSHGLHMTSAAYVATGFLVAGIHALGLLKEPTSVFHRRALAIALIVGGLAAVTQPISGDRAGEIVARYQPAKLAALEGLFKTEKRAPLTIGGYVETAQRRTVYGLRIPLLLSLIALRDPNATVSGLDAFARQDWPPFLPLLHLSFDAMVGIGFLLLALTLWGVCSYWRTRQVPTSRGFLLALICAAPLGMIAVELGWIVTELGRQPWIIYGIMRTSSGVTPMPGLIAPFIAITLVYLLLMAVVIQQLWMMTIDSPRRTSELA
ncbi:MAG TPA: cytochrome ubiquinol oxidase subunit I [Candidatus Binataceae bacterium]|nr:cytochrome ubiquinol oxidase subunit I [Candidatus Binataceae bacterium]